MKLFSLAPLAVVLLQVAVNPLQQQKPTGSIEGTITRSGTTQPVVNARVTVTRRGQPAPAGALPPNAIAVTPTGARGAAPAPIAPVTTDDKGKFVVPALEDGNYSVQASANGYVSQSNGQTGPVGAISLATVSGGQPKKDVNISLVPAGNVSGRIRDTSDQPLVNLQVQLLRSSYDTSGQRTYQTVGTALTDDHGEYRMYWVTPGRYYLLVGKPTTGGNPLESLIAGDMAPGASGNAVPSVLGYAFYPGVTDIANARSLDLQPGSDLQSIDLSLATKPRTFKIRGKLVDSRTGQPPSRASVFVSTQMPGLNSEVDQYSLGPDGPSPNYNCKTGVFEIRDLLPGIYSVVGTVMDPPVPGRPGPLARLSGMTAVSIGSSDVDDAVISVVPAASLPGRVRIDGQLPAQMSIDKLRVQLIPVGTGSGPRSLSSVLSGAFYQNPQVVLGADGSFRLNNIVPGDYRIDFSGFPININGQGGTQFFGSMQTGNAYIKDARFDGADVIAAPLHFSGSANNGLEVVLGFGSGRVSGTVLDARSQPVSSRSVVIVPDRARFRTDLFRTLGAGQNGQFNSSPLPPGDYKVFAWESIEDNAWFDPDVLSRVEGRATSVHISDGSTQTITVQIIPAEASR